MLGADDGGEANLTYTWATTGTPPAAVAFSSNASNDAKSTTATFTQAGDYTFAVTITDQGGLSTTSTVNVTVNQTLTSVAVSPASADITAGGTQQFTATAYDQFGTAISNQSFTWAIVTGAGSIDDTSGLYTPPYAPAVATMQAADNGTASSPASVTVTGQAQWNSSADASWNDAGSWADSISSTIVAAPGVRGIAGDTVPVCRRNRRNCPARRREPDAGRHHVRRRHDELHHRSGKRRQRHAPGRRRRGGHGSGWQPHDQRRR